MTIKPWTLKFRMHNGCLVPIIKLVCDDVVIRFVGWKQDISMNIVNSTQIFHWFYNHDRKSFDPPIIHQTYSKNDIYLMLRTVHAILDSEIFDQAVAYNKDRASQGKDLVTVSLHNLGEVPELRRTVYAAILGALSDHYKVDSSSRTGRQYLDIRTKRAKKRKASIFIPDLAALPEPLPLGLPIYERIG